MVKHKEKFRLHIRNKHRNRYNFEELIATCPELAPFVKLNTYNNKTIDFADNKAVIMLNRALLKHYYGITYWNIPKNYLCPPIPGRADYIHYIADLLGNSNNERIPTGNKIKCLDIGVGANCVYPIIGNKEYDWTFIGADIDPISIKSAKEIVELNSSLHGKIELKLQRNIKDIFTGIIHEKEFFDCTICNPPFHASLKEAAAGTLRKLSNLEHKKISNVKLNFGGHQNELCCNGGEKRFIHNMIIQSRQFYASCFWFTTLVSKQSNLKSIYNTLDKVNAVEIKTIPMGQGNKTSRIVAWTFLNKKQKEKWITTRWEKN